MKGKGSLGNLLGIAVCLIGLMSVNTAWAGKVMFGHKDYIRSTGAPVMVADTFSAFPATTYKIEVFNGGLESTSNERVSASVIYLNGQLIFGTSDFNQNVTYLSKPVTLQANNNLKVEVRSKPGGKLTIKVVSTDETAPVIAITSPVNGYLTNQTNLTVSGTINDNSATVKVNSVTATVANGIFSASGIPLTEGVNTITVMAADPVDNRSSASVNVTLDTISPYIAITSPLNGFITNQNSLTLSGTTDDNNAIITVNGITATVADGGFTAGGLTLTQGSNNIIVTAADMAGNSSTLSIAGTLDTIAPQINITSPITGFLTNQSVISVSGTVSDNFGLAAVLVNGINATINNGAFTVPGITLAEGNNTLTVTVIDLAGNSSNTMITGALDTIAPTVTITSPANDFLTNHNTINVSGTVNDNSAIVTVNSVTATVTNGIFTSDNISLSEGSNTITIIAADPAANSNSATVSGTKDTIAPAIDITSPANGLITNQVSLTVSGTINDNSATVVVNGITATIINGTFTTSGLTLTEGSNTITATATDSVGNTGQSSVIITLDATAPQITVTSPANGFLTNQTLLTVTGSIDDNTASVTVYGITASITNGILSAGITLSEGANSIIILATDSVGNSTSKSLNVTSDTTAPTISITAPLNNSSLDTATPLITITFNDSGSGFNPASLQISLNGEDKTADFTLTADGATWQVIQPLPDGTYQIAAQINDQAGNNTGVTSNFTIATSHEPPVTPISGFIHGQVLNAKTDNPLEGAKVTARDISGEILTDAYGKFAFPTPEGGTFYLLVEKDGYTSAYRQAQVISTRDTLVETIYLTPLDAQTTLLTPAGGIIGDSGGNVELNVPAGAVSENVQIRITAVESLEDMPAPQPDYLLFLFCGKFEPSGLVFNTPVTLRVANTLGFDPGEEIPLTRWNEQTYVWDEAGTGIVSSDGQWVECAITHFSYYHYNGLLKSYLAGRIEGETSDTDNDGQESSGCLIASIARETPAGLLTNISAQAATDVLIRSKISKVLGIAPSRLEWKFSVEGTEKKVTFSGSAVASYQDFMWDTKNGRGEKVPTGSYPYIIETTEVFDPGTYEYHGKQTYINREVIFKSAMTGRIIVIHETDSPYGAGWVLGSVPRLHFAADGYIVLTEGNGRGIVFTPAAGETYLSPEGDYSALTQNADGTYTRRMKDGFAWHFNAAGRLSAKTDRNGNATVYTYDQDGRLTGITDSFGRSTLLTYDAAGHLASMMDKAGRVSLFNIDAEGNLSSVTDPEGKVTAYTYGAGNLLASKTDPSNQTTAYQYDPYGRLTQIVSPEGTENNYQPSYGAGLLNNLPPGTGDTSNPAPAVVEASPRVHSDGSGNAVRYKLNKFGAVIQETDALNNVTSYERGCSCGAPTKISYPNGRIVTMTYDGMGNLLTRREDSNGALTSYTYEPVFNQVTSVTDPKGRTTNMNYDESGNLTQITDPLNQITALTYNNRGQLVSVADALNHITTFSYDGTTGNLISATDDLGNVTAYTYDQADNLLTASDAEGKTSVYTYDLANRLTGAAAAFNGVTGYEYDAESNLIKITDAKTQITLFSYDTDNRLSAVANPASESKTYRYDGNGNLAFAADAEGQTVGYSYDPLNRLAQKNLPDNLTVDYEYNIIGNLTTVHSPRAYTFMEYDLPGRLISTTTVVNTRNDEYANFVALSNNTVINPGDLTYDGADILVVDGATVTIGGTHTFKDIAILHGGKLIPPSGSELNLTADNVLIDSSSGIDASGKGYARGRTLGNTIAGASFLAGGSYGGYGGYYYWYAGRYSNAIYGDYRNPNELGSGGASGGTSGGGQGGGLIRISAETMTLNGTIKADGIDSGNYAGSGGGIRLDVGTISGNGTISAIGGRAVSGGGGGGRIALYYNNKDNFTGNLKIYGEFTSNELTSGAGTIYLKSAAQTYGDLIVDNNGGRTDLYSTILRAIGGGTSDGIAYDPATGQSTLTKTGANWPLPNFTTGALGLKGLFLNPNISQTQTFEVIDNSATTITVDGDMTLTAAAGDTYIGEYTFDNIYLKGKALISTDDVINVLGTAEINNATLKAHALKLADSSQLQAVNASLNLTETLFDGQAEVVLDGDSLTTSKINATNSLKLRNGTSLTISQPLNVPQIELNNNSKIIAASGTLNINAQTLTINSGCSIDASGKGYARGYTLGNTTAGASVMAGGSYGGNGGYYWWYSGRYPNSAYGDYRNPNELGSGGASGGSGTGQGGGLIRISAGTLTLNGTIKADGTSTAQYGCSGGGIRLDVGVISGSGTINANGANGEGGGGGGRIALYYTDKSGFSGGVKAKGGNSYGGAGTVYLKSSVQQYGDLIIDNNGYDPYLYSTILRAIGGGTSDGIAYNPATGQSTLTKTGANWPLPNLTTGALGLKGLTLNPNLNQSQTFPVIDNSATTITVSGDMTLIATAGDTYIGQYLLDNLTVTGQARVNTSDDIYATGTVSIGAGSYLSAHAVYEGGLYLGQTLYAALKLQTEPLMQARKFWTYDYLLAGLEAPALSSPNAAPDLSSPNAFIGDIVLGKGEGRSIKGEKENTLSQPATDNRQQSTNYPLNANLYAYAQTDTASDAFAPLGDGRDGGSSSSSLKSQASNLDPSYTYDIIGLRTSMTDPTGTTTYEYDALDRVTRITNPTGQAITFSYDAVNKRTGLTHSNGLTASYTYDRVNRLTALAWQMNGTIIAGFTYTYDRVGNRLTMTDEHGMHSYTYDNTYQLTGADHPAAQASVNPDETYAYDPVGNRWPSVNVYDAANRLLEDADYMYTYNRNGSLTSKTERTSGEAVKYYWSAENQLVKIEKYHPNETTPYSISTYIYDGFGRRVAKNVNNAIIKYLYDNEDILLEMDVNDNVVARYTHGPGIDEPLIMSRGGQSYYFVTDGLGSVVKLVDSNETAVNNYVYNSFGNIAQKTETVTNPYTYTAREFDSESGLYHYRARYYDAQIGRFINEDFYSGNIWKPMSLHKYLYAHNNPINWADPDGQDPITLTLTALTAVGISYDIWKNISPIYDSCGKLIGLRIPPPSMFTKGFSLPFFLGVDVRFKSYDVPFLGEIGVPTSITGTIDPKLKQDK